MVTRLECVQIVDAKKKCILWKDGVGDAEMGISCFMVANGCVYETLQIEIQNFK